MMSDVFMYGVLQYTGAQPGDFVRFIPGPRAGKPGAISQPRVPSEVNATLESVKGSVGYCRLKPQLRSARAEGDVGTASGIVIDLSLSAGGSLKIN